MNTICYTYITFTYQNQDKLYIHNQIYPRVRLNHPSKPTNF